ncbi:helix-turn-helix domain-containing protein [Pseudomonas sp. NPDC089734]|uniref:helix-turn-helix domain-containing protein n=1 Tax=Pseudomonas sp. NPDC089734 TaxID=3364469 RepID=UPI0037F45C43
MNNKSSHSSSHNTTPLDLSAAVEQFVAQGGVIAVIPDGETAESPMHLVAEETPVIEPDLEKSSKVELLKSLAAKGAGVSALQYSLRMNKKDIRQLAMENGVKINFSRPIKEPKKETHYDTADIDDAVAGHAMHYSSLGYTVPEIAQLLDLSIRQVWNIGKAYRFEFKQYRDGDTP